MPGLPSEGGAASRTQRPMNAGTVSSWGVQGGGTCQAGLGAAERRGEGAGVTSTWLGAWQPCKDGELLEQKAREGTSWRLFLDRYLGQVGSGQCHVT